MRVIRIVNCGCACWTHKVQQTVCRIVPLNARYDD
jgi:hypothetical protein